jgi:hypothetical protein
MLEGSWFDPNTASSVFNRSDAFIFFIVSILM